MASAPVIKSKEFAAALKAARIGAPEAQYEVGLMFANGLGTPQDLTQAIVWISKAAERGLPAAQYLLATRYAGGIAVAKDDRLALAWFVRAADQGHTKAIFKLGQMLGNAHPQAQLACIREAADAGLPEAQHALGLSFVSGQGQGQDLRLAFLWYEKSARQGFAPAQYALACLFMEGKGTSHSPEDAVVWYRAAALQDHPAAQVALELIDQAQTPLRNGSIPRSRRRATSKERRKGSERWRKAAALGDADAAYQVALMHELGLGVEKDLALARDLYLSAAQQFDLRAQLALAKLLEAESAIDEALFWYEKAAHQCSSEAEFALGRLYAGNSKLPSDPLTGLTWYARSAASNNPAALWTLGQLLSGEVHHLVAACFAGAADRGLVEAQFRLGECYAQGQGVARDPAMAAQWWAQAATQGHGDAAHALAIAYLDGVGIPKDEVQAAFWLEKAAVAGHAKAQWNLGGLYASGGGGVAQDLTRAFHYCQQSAEQGFGPGQATLGLLYHRIGKAGLSELWLRKAAEQGDPEACFNLAMLLRSDVGTAQESAFIIQLLADAAEQGIAEAQFKLGYCYATADRVPFDPVEAHKWFLIACDSGYSLAEQNLAHSSATFPSATATEGERRARQWLKSFKSRHMKNDG